MPILSLVNLEKEIADLILDKLEHLEITPVRASQIAKFALSVLPDSLTEEQITTVIPKLDDNFYELAAVVHKHLSEYEEHQREIIKNEAVELIHQGQMDKASVLMKKFFDQKLK
ncbi:MAG: hypothetical protein UV73_C0007G0056 [Candidatus Gottesmanbacteria bacterium GW2011_GWA2_43_14]|uniref:Uncharacterized protein n=1 Tax=Candidatus Gottesmanbacteria bacterium GW2011_GWA2_43_14 TaxID=1618443 RepID=A0A0G1GFK6_9BACT|nr:MAG: hypothetical protein UV73_C0007G0056 [Candidatus Gottesmanbacteria bacterium GW2011_GWA2_43_14]